MKIGTILEKIDENQLFIPAFQREYVWKRDDVKQLVDSLIKEYPTGTMLTWETANPPELKGPYKYNEKQGAVRLLLDGQQRITSLYMLIKGEDANNIHLQDTMKADCFEGQDMRIVIINPPFGQAWGGKDAADGVESAVKKEHKKAEKYEGSEKMEHSRFPWGLPTSGDMQLLFMQHAIYKMSKDGRAAIISNGSPLFSGNTTSGESQIRRYMLENDLIEAIVALPTDLFYNTSIGIYAFILSKNKRSERRGKIQLINAVDMWKPLRKSLGKKRKEISKEDIARITEIYAGFEDGPYCKIFDNEEFMYKEYAVYQPLQRRGSLSAANIAALKTSAIFTANSFIFNEADYEVLLETDPREGEDEKKFLKFLYGKIWEILKKKFLRIGSKRLLKLIVNI